MSRPMADTPKRRPRRRFDDDFKAQAVRLVLDEGKSVGSVAPDLDLTETALREWVHRARRSHEGEDGPHHRRARGAGVAPHRESNPPGGARSLKNRIPGPGAARLVGRNSVAYARTPGAVAVRFLVTS